MADTASLARIRVLVFDVMGTVVDLDGTAGRALTEVLDPSVDGSTVLTAWNAGLQARLDEIVSGTAPWRPHAELRAEALRAALRTAGVGDLDAEALARLDATVHEADPWPDSAAALARLREHRTVVALSNAGVAELAGLSRHGGLAWHGVVSAASVRDYKPSLVVYETAIAQLECPPTEILMVAAHPWDLRAAAACGLRTAFVRRPDARELDTRHDFTLEVGDLTELADRFDQRRTLGASSL